MRKRLKSQQHRKNSMSIEEIIILNLLNKLRKSDKLLGMQSILSLPCNKLNEFKNWQHRKKKIYLDIGDLK